MRVKSILNKSSSSLFNNKKIGLKYLVLGLGVQKNLSVIELNTKDTF